MTIKILSAERIIIAPSYPTLLLRLAVDGEEIEAIAPGPGEQRRLGQGLAFLMPIGRDPLPIPPPPWKNEAGEDMEPVRGMTDDPEVLRLVREEAEDLETGAWRPGKLDLS